PFQAIAETGRIGSINSRPDSDGVFRRYYVHLDAGGWQIPSLAARVTEAVGYPLPQSADVEMNWRGTIESRVAHSFSDVFADLDRERPERYAELVRGRIVVV